MTDITEEYAIARGATHKDSNIRPYLYYKKIGSKWHYFNQWQKEWTNSSNSSDELANLMPIDQNKVAPNFTSADIMDLRNSEGIGIQEAKRILQRKQAKELILEAHYQEALLLLLELTE